MPHAEREQPQPDYRTYLTAYERAWERYHQELTEQHRDLVLTSAQLLYGELMKPGRFELGQAVATPGAVEAMQRGGHIPPECLLRHKHGDWCDLDPEDTRVNEDAPSMDSDCCRPITHVCRTSSGSLPSGIGV